MNKFVAIGTAVCALSGATYFSLMENKRQMRHMDLLLSQSEVQHFERDGKQFYYDPLHGCEYHK